MTITFEQSPVQEVRVPQGTIRYREMGTGDPILLVHGFMVNSLLWRKVVPRLAGDFRVIAPDWPMGSHEVPLGADLTPPGFARLVADFMAALDLRDVTLVGNDTGGGMCQIVVVNHPERLGRLVASCHAVIESGNVAELLSTRLGEGWRPEEASKEASPDTNGSGSVVDLSSTRSGSADEAASANTSPATDPAARTNVGLQWLRRFRPDLVLVSVTPPIPGTRWRRPSASASSTGRC